jgi:hypothetical protein
MSDMTPQAVFGFDEAALRKMIREEFNARNARPSRIAAIAGYIAARLREPTSYAGLGLLVIPVLSRFGVSFSDDQWGAVVDVAIGAAGLASFMLRERGTVPVEQGQ